MREGELTTGDDGADLEGLNDEKAVINEGIEALDALIEGFRVTSLLAPVSLRIPEGGPLPLTDDGICREGAEACRLEASETRREWLTTVLPEIVLVAVAVELVLVVD